MEQSKIPVIEFQSDYCPSCGVKQKKEELSFLLKFRRCRLCIYLSEKNATNVPPVHK
jgi:hypothetical protein